MFCTTTEQCLNYITNSECSSGQCYCLIDHQPDSSRLHCVASQCQRDATCYTTSCCQLADKNSVCDVTLATSSGAGVCACVTNYVPSVGGGQCAKKYLIGDKCSSSTQCSTVMADSTCSASTGQCACVNGYQALQELAGCTRIPLSKVNALLLRRVMHFLSVEMLINSPNSPVLHRLNIA